MHDAKCWLPLIVTIPPRPAPDGDRLVVSLRLTQEKPVVTKPWGQHWEISGTQLVRERHCDSPTGPVLPVWVTHGYEESIVP